MKDKIYIVAWLLSILFFIPACDKEMSGTDDSGYILLGVEKMKFSIPKLENL
ncbi:MAG: hypothetical protein LUJ25_10105 [Firmicutes bacterium]|nr:hypothetical protein [Bacillota bacterium]